MSLYRLYTYDPPGTPFYKDPSQGGFLYNTGRYDDSLPAGQGCLSPDPQGFNDFPSLLSYAASHNETLRGPLTRDQVNVICTAGTVPAPGISSTNTPAVTQPTTPITQPPTGVSGCMAGVCGPTYTPGPAAVIFGVPPTNVTPGIPSVTVNIPNHPDTGTLSTGGGAPGGIQQVGTTAGPQPATPTGVATGTMGTGFNLTAFVKSPLGILVLVLLVVILLVREGA